MKTTFYPNKIFTFASERNVAFDSEDREENPTMNKALKLFTEGDTMEATIVEAFEDMEEGLREAGVHSSNRIIFVGTDMDALFRASEDIAAGPDGMDAEELYSTPSGDIDQHMEYMFEEQFELSYIRAFTGSIPVSAVLFSMKNRADVQGLADYFAFLYDGYADVYVE